MKFFRTGNDLQTKKDKLGKDRLFPMLRKWCQGVIILYVNLAGPWGAHLVSQIIFWIFLWQYFCEAWMEQKPDFSKINRIILSDSLLNGVSALLGYTAAAWQPWNSEWDISSADFGPASLHNHSEPVITALVLALTLTLLLGSISLKNTDKYTRYHLLGDLPRPTWISLQWLERRSPRETSRLPSSTTYLKKMMCLVEEHKLNLSLTYDLAEEWKLSNYVN